MFWKYIQSWNVHSKTVQSSNTQRIKSGLSFSIIADISDSSFCEQEFSFLWPCQIFSVRNLKWYRYAVETVQAIVSLKLLLNVRSSSSKQIQKGSGSNYRSLACQSHAQTLPLGYHAILHIFS